MSCCDVASTNSLKHLARIECGFYFLPQLLLIVWQLERRASPDRAHCALGGSLEQGAACGRFDLRRAGERTVAIKGKSCRHDEILGT
jgi:hypothetical protein